MNEYCHLGNFTQSLKRYYRKDNFDCNLSIRKEGHKTPKRQHQLNSHLIDTAMMYSNSIFESHQHEHTMKTIYSTTLLVLLIISVWTNGVLSCPSICSCRTTNNTVLVDCINGGLTTIPTDFPSDSYRINIYNNIITTIEERAFQNMTLLIEIYLSGNQITTIQKGTFIDLPALEYIYLSGNRITILQQGTFEDLPALALIELDNSRITTIQNGAFKNLPALKNLNIRGNRITSLQQGTFEDLPALQKYVCLSYTTLYQNQN
ncbi:unnamed protein product [Mytilus edulis]|uniref:LRRNT domain-containing protein n=1 Tax=Mytilus edulis TaxID=6550 RepID=A0A8S3SLH7_MYTED|nr:unnamed protein product [Mytilus edulis]